MRNIKLEELSISDLYVVMKLTNTVVRGNILYHVRDAAEKEIQKRIALIDEQLKTMLPV